jgi:segregation and condensation protein A
LERKHGRLGFRPLLAACQTRTEIVVLFLAVLELIKSGRLWAEQDQPFGDIVLVEGVADRA